ncbi:MAG: hypothetical protein K0S61_2383 [Anaerocolumna sp.]|jgi:hypothetical protein|nr:hypothetical protein [Anaerocolumna sp.]
MKYLHMIEAVLSEIEIILSFEGSLCFIIRKGGKSESLWCTDAMGGTL